jgi:hypothetical protein
MHCQNTKRENGTDLFSVSDRAIPNKNLSGGKSFIVRLALAAQDAGGLFDLKRFQIPNAKEPHHFVSDGALRIKFPAATT